jgi:hypothetical protein
MAVSSMRAWLSSTTEDQLISSNKDVFPDCMKVVWKVGRTNLEYFCEIRPSPRM